jgi:hypothetical protein
MTNAERQKAEIVTLRAEVVRLKRELAEAHAKAIAWKPMKIEKVGPQRGIGTPPRPKAEAPDDPGCGGVGRCGKLGCAHGGRG